MHNDWFQSFFHFFNKQASLSHFKSLNQFQSSYGLTQSYSQHQLLSLFSHSFFQGHSRDSSPSSIWFNPDQMLIGLFGCWPSAWAAGQLWQAVLSCAVPSLSAKVWAAQRPLHNQRTFDDQSSTLTGNKIHDQTDLFMICVVGQHVHLSLPCY